MAKHRTKRLSFRYKPQQLLRAAVFKRDDFTCQMCGWKPFYVPDNYDGKKTLATWVGKKLRLLEIDHIIPRIEGGTHDIGNLQTLCDHCNRVKGSRVLVN